jgi:hypothetical protein
MAENSPRSIVSYFYTCQPLAAARGAWIPPGGAKVEAIETLNSRIASQQVAMSGGFSLHVASRRSETMEIDGIYRIYCNPENPEKSCKSRLFPEEVT